MPQEVRLYDVDGRMVVQAMLSKPELLLQNQDDEAATADAPKMTTQYEIFFPVGQTRLKLVLERPSLRNGKVPNEKTFETLAGSAPNVSAFTIMKRAPRYAR